MLTIVDNPCSVCRGEATTSDAQCQCAAPTANVGSSSASNHRTRCVNCGVLATTSSLCARCNALPRCRRCKRHLPRRCFRQFDDDDDDEENDDGGGGDGERSHLCRACDRRRGRPTVRKSTGSVVTEINIPLGDAAYNSFDSFMAAHQDELRQHVEEYRQLHRYVILHGCKSTRTCRVFSNYIDIADTHDRSTGQSLAPFIQTSRAQHTIVHIAMSYLLNYKPFPVTALTRQLVTEGTYHANGVYSVATAAITSR